jgi:hypothetical protein
MIGARIWVGTPRSIRIRQRRTRHRRRVSQLNLGVRAEIAQR